MKKLLAALVLVGLVGCGEAKKPEPKLPTPPVTDKDKKDVTDKAKEVVKDAKETVKEVTK